MLEFAMVTLPIHGCQFTRPKLYHVVMMADPIAALQSSPWQNGTGDGDGSWIDCFDALVPHDRYRL